MNKQDRKRAMQIDEARHEAEKVLNKFEDERFRNGPETPAKFDEDEIYDALDLTYQALRAACDMVDRRNQAVMKLTPGGSEFVDNFDRCLGFVHDRLSNMMKVAKSRNEMRARLKAAPEPVANPSEAWVEGYADWFEGRFE